MKTQTKLFITALIALNAWSCSQKNTSQSTSSRITPTTGYNSSTQAFCSIGSSASSSAQVSAYREVNGQIRPEFVKIRFNNIPAAFYSDSGSAIQVYRWKGDNEVDQTAVNLVVYNAITGQEVQSANNIRWSDINNGTTQKLSDYIIRVELQDYAGDYDAIKIVYYSSSKQVVDYFDALLPVFDAHPSSYARDPDTGLARASVLQALHPFKNMASSSAEQLSLEANKYCF